MKTNVKMNSVTGLRYQLIRKRQNNSDYCSFRDFLDSGKIIYIKNL
jgi:hypothetical protein